MVPLLGSSNHPPHRPSAVVSSLNAAVAASPDIIFGSYPVDQGAVKTVVTLEAASTAQKEIDDAVASFVAALPKGSVAAVSEVAEVADVPDTPNAPQ